MVTTSTGLGQVGGREIARVDVLANGDARVVAQPPVELAVTDVERDDVARAALQEHVGEPAGGRADVQRGSPRSRPRECVERVRQLQAAAAHERMIRRDERRRRHPRRRVFPLSPQPTHSRAPARPAPARARVLEWPPGRERREGVKALTHEDRVQGPEVRGARCEPGAGCKQACARCRARCTLSTLHPEPWHAAFSSLPIPVGAVFISPRSFSISTLLGVFEARMAEARQLHAALVQRKRLLERRSPSSSFLTMPSSSASAASKSLMVVPCGSRMSRPDASERPLSDSRRF